MERQNTIYTRSEAAEIVGMFEDLLSSYGIVVPGPEDGGREEGSTASLYGSTYYDLLDSVEDYLCGLLDRHGSETEIIQDEFSDEGPDVEEETGENMER
jgi:hypothetical protein